MIGTEPVQGNACWNHGLRCFTQNAQAIERRWCRLRDGSGRYAAWPFGLSLRSSELAAAPLGSNSIVDCREFECDSGQRKEA